MGLKGCDGTPPGGDGLCWLVFCRGEELMIACFTEREREREREKLCGWKLGGVLEFGT